MLHICKFVSWKFDFMIFSQKIFNIFHFAKIFSKNIQIATLFQFFISMHFLAQSGIFCIHYQQQRTVPAGRGWHSPEGNVLLTCPLQIGKHRTLLSDIGRLRHSSWSRPFCSPLLVRRRNTVVFAKRSAPAIEIFVLISN